MINKIANRIFEFLQRRCPHDSAWVSADILEGALRGGSSMASVKDDDQCVQWCKRCGAYRVTNGTFGAWTGWEWHSPYATWTEDYKPTGESLKLKYAPED